jgi:hypothetical protein
VKPPKRVGVLRAFTGDGSCVVVSIEQENGNVASMFVHAPVADSLVSRFGVRAGDSMDMRAIVGRNVEYVESDSGFVTNLAVVQDEVSR